MKGGTEAGKEELVQGGNERNYGFSFHLSIVISCIRLGLSLSTFWPVEYFFLLFVFGLFVLLTGLSRSSAILEITILLY